MGTIGPGYKRVVEDMGISHEWDDLQLYRMQRPLSVSEYVELPVVIWNWQIIVNNYFDFPILNRGVLFYDTRESNIFGFNFEEHGTEVCNVDE
jgi:hypothetical protein